MAQVTVYSFDGKDYFLVTKIDSYLYPFKIFYGCSSPFFP